jgi:RNA polymerase sigma-70 factor (ECF subfamily)
MNQLRETIKKGNFWPLTRGSFISELQVCPAGGGWDEFAEIYVPLVFRFCRSRGVQDADARDITQNVFMSVHGGINSFDARRGRFRSWLGTIAIRAISRHFRRTRKAGLTMEGMDQVEAEATDAAWLAEFNIHIYQTAITRIQGDFEQLTWSAFDLLWNQDLSPSEVATRLEKPVDWVYQGKYRVMRRLEQEVKILTADIPSFLG